jgi:hypothetical protein
MFNIEKNIPLPTRKDILHAEYPFKDMEIGDSFLLDFQAYHRTQSAATYYARKSHVKFAFRQISKSKYRCWRIE